MIKIVLLVGGTANGSQLADGLVEQLLAIVEYSLLALEPGIFHIGRHFCCRHIAKSRCVEPEQVSLKHTCQALIKRIVGC